MKTLTLIVAFASLVSLNANFVSAEIIVFEDFEDSNVSYTPSSPDNFLEIDDKDYYGRISPSTAIPPTDVVYNNLQGTGYYGVQDTDSIATGSADSVTLDWTGIDTSGHQNLKLSFFLAEDDATDGNEDWDAISAFTVSVQLDSSGFVQVFQVAAENADNPNSTGSGDQINVRPLVDTDFNGIGDGIEITDVFTEFSVDLADADSVDIRINMVGLDSSDEDFAFDNVRLVGDLAAVPEPSLTLMLFGVSFLSLTKRRRQA
jgi:hypothetical protein